MEVQFDAGVHHDLSHDLCGNELLPSLEHMSLEASCSDNSFGSRDAAAALSENGDTDYDLDSEMDDEEEDEEEYSGEDESQVDALIDDLEIKFRNLVSAKISEAEQFFDDASALQRLITQSALVEKQVDESVSAARMSYNDEGIEEGDSGSKEKIKKLNFNSKDMYPAMKDMDTQTDMMFISSSLAKMPSSSPLEESKSTLEGPEQARAEIGQLRDVRESLIVQRQQWAAQLKQAEDRNADEAKKAECKVYEIEEAIEAVDTAIEFKNEVVLGQPPNKIVATDITPGSNEAELVTRLESLSIEELRRLLCIYFAKVVELRSSSRILEKHVEHAESSNDQLSRRLARDHKHLREMHTEYQTRIRMILSSNNPNSAVYTCFRRMDEQLAAAHKKQHDLERSLTELLVRHGYLVNGADYDVKQVVKMLGIEGQLAGTVNTVIDRDSGSRATTADQRPAPHSSRSGWQKVARGTSSLGHRRNGRQLDGHELSRLHRDVRMVEGWEREHRQAPVPQPAEVRREKRRLIIQPSNGAPTSGHSHHHGASSSHNNHHHYNHAPSAHGSNHHPGYK